MYLKCTVQEREKNKKEKKYKCRKRTIGCDGEKKKRQLRYPVAVQEDEM